MRSLSFAPVWYSNYKYTVRCPPAGTAVAVPVASPKQFASVAMAVAVNAAAGWVTVAVAVVVQRFASVTVTVYVPAVRFVAVAVVCTGVVFQL